MRGFVQDGSVMEVVAVAAIKSGDIVAQGELVGVTVIDAAIGEVATVVVSGVVSLKKKATEVWAQGDALYADTESQQVTKTAAEDDSTPQIGWAWRAAVANDATGQVRLRF